MKRGDVVLVPFPNSDLKSAKLRPALIVQADNLETNLNQLIIAMISTNLSRANHPSRVFISIKTLGVKSSRILTIDIDYNKLSYANPAELWIVPSNVAPPKLMLINKD